MCVRGLLVLTSSLGSVRVLSFLEYRYDTGFFFFFFFFFFFLRVQRSLFFFFFFFFFFSFGIIKLMRCESPKVWFFFFFFFFFFSRDFCII